MDATNVILAECPGLGRVRLCDCDAVHVNIGPVTINLEPEAFMKTAILLQKRYGTTHTNKKLFRNVD